jgi:phage major head subunit gpT-like protein
MCLIEMTPARSLGQFKAPDERGERRTMEVIAANTGHLVALREGMICVPQTTPEIAVALAERILAGDTNAMSVNALNQIALALVAVALEQSMRRAEHG